MAEPQLHLWIGFLNHEDTGDQLDSLWFVTRYQDRNLAAHEAYLQFKGRHKYDVTRPMVNVSYQDSAPAKQAKQLWERWLA